MEAIRGNLAECIATARRACRPPPRLKISGWADAKRRLSPESSAEPGQWRTSRAPYQREIMDAIGDASIDEVVVMTSAQVGKTSIVENVIGYYIEQDPSPILVVQPSLEMAETFSKDRLAPMVRDTPSLTGLIAEPNAKTSGNTILHKQFHGGHVTISGANSEKSLSSRPIRVLLLDEVDRYEIGLGIEGDPVSLAKARTRRFFNRRVALFSTPTTKEGSRILRAWGESDRRRYFVPCRGCGEFQVFRWANVRWPEGKPEEARYACEHCGVLWDEGERIEAIDAGEWRATARFAGIAGFHLWEAMTKWSNLPVIAAEFLRAREHVETLKVFVNTTLGEPWEDRAGEALTEETLRSRRGAWDAEGLPDDVICATAGVDVQDDRLEVSIVAWCEGERARVAAHHILYGSPGEDAVWTALDRLLLEKLPTKDGRRIRIVTACVDSGGHHAKAVYSWCLVRTDRGVYAIKGAGGTKPAWPLRATPSRRHRGVVWVIGVDTIKDWLRGALRVRDETLPHHFSFAATLDDEYFDQLLAEKCVSKYDKSGKETRRWVKPKAARNEALDALVYALAALEAAKKIHRLRLQMAPRREIPAAAPIPSPASRGRMPPRPAGGFVRGWK